MSQCVPNWDLCDPPPSSGRPPIHKHSSSAAHDVVPMLEYEVAELTWQNGHLAMHGHGPPRPAGKFQLGSGGDGLGGGSKYTWDNKPARASGTLESLVNQGTTGHADRKIVGYDVGTDGGDLVPWFADHHRAAAAVAVAAAEVAIPAPSVSTTMDALVPCDGTAAAATVESNDIPVAAAREEEVEDCGLLRGKRARGVARVVSTCDSQQVTLDACERDFAVGSGGGGFTNTTATSQGSAENTSSGRPCMKTTTTTTDDHDSVCHSTPQGEDEDEADKKKDNAKPSSSTKRNRAAAIHNQSERKRRDKINQRMKTLQKLVPNSNKTDKASMLDEVIEYLKQLQAQVHMMSRMNMPAAMMLPMAMQQQLPMASLMAPMGLAGMGMAGMGMGMDHLNMISGRSSLATGMSPLLQPTAFVPIAAWDGGTSDQLQLSPTMMMADPLSTFLACQSQPMTVEAYNRIATMFQQLRQHPSGGLKN